ncbi:hypothetical protein HY485_02145 [Candidatus Woesearchaeota archaeon]|nr:hypothetical protein [Candidatus Woesearchaeota archaeon]
MFDPKKVFGVIIQQGHCVSLEVTVSFAQVKTVDTCSNEVKYLLIAIPDIIESVAADIKAVSGMSGERNTTKSYVGELTRDALVDKLVGEKHYKRLLGPLIENFVYLRPPHDELDKNINNSDVIEYLDIGILPED